MSVSLAQNPTDFEPSNESKCAVCENLAPSNCTYALCAEHCNGCTIHRPKGNRRDHKQNTYHKPARSTSQGMYEKYYDEDFEMALKLSMASASEDDSLEQALRESIRHEESILQQKIQNLKLVFSHIPDRRIEQVLKTCKGNEEEALDQLLTVETAETLSTIIEQVTLEEPDECCICLDSYECFTTACNCCKMCENCHKVIMKKKCPICKVFTQLSAE